MYKIATLMLLGDKVKYIMLISAIAFSTFLITQQLGMFCGVMNLTVNVINNSNAPIWVVDPYVENVDVTKTLRDNDLLKVKSVSGVKWAVPLSKTLALATLPTGHFFNVFLIGVDSTSLAGIPSDMVFGDARGLYQEGGVIVDQIGLKTLSKGRKKLLELGDEIIINDHKLHIVGVVRAQPNLTSFPTIYTTYNRAVEVAPPVRNSIGYILVQPKDGADLKALADEIYRETGLRSFTREALSLSTMWWVTAHAGIPVTFAVTCFLGIVVGISVTGQTFYSFINENLSNIGALKAMGISHSLLNRMLLLQASIVGVVGYGIGIFFTVLFGSGLILFYKVVPVDFPLFFYIPFYLPIEVLVITFLMMICICSFAVFFGIQKVKALQPAEVFRT